MTNTFKKCTRTTSVTEENHASQYIFLRGIQIKVGAVVFPDCDFLSALKQKHIAHACAVRDIAF